MRQGSYEDAKGRKWAVMLPEGVPDSDAAMGVPLGPPSLEPLGLPDEIEVRLHNELFHRRLFTLKEVKNRRQDIVGALFSTFKIDAERIAQLYRKEAEDGQKTERQKVKPTKRQGRRR